MAKISAVSAGGGRRSAPGYTLEWMFRPMPFLALGGVAPAGGIRVTVDLAQAAVMFGLMEGEKLEGAAQLLRERHARA